MTREMPDHDTRHLVKVLWRRYWHLSSQVDRHASHLHRLKEKLMATQEDLNAVAQRLSDLKTTLTADDAALAQAIADLQTQAQNQGATLDLTQVNQALDDLSAQVDATGALVPADQPPAA